MSALAKPFYTVEQYLELEEKAETKSEYLSGQIFAMSGGSPRHSRIAANIIRRVGNALDAEPCEIYTSDLRVTIMPTGLKTYPDLTVVCGEPYFHPLDTNSLINPQVLIEVLSPSTEGYDRGEKWANYRQLDSLQEYVLVSQHAPQVEVYTRQEGGAWKFTATTAMDGKISLPSLGCELEMAEIYEKIEFDPLVSVSEPEEETHEPARH